jgi:glutamate decarboxylase
MATYEEMIRGQRRAAPNDDDEADALPSLPTPTPAPLDEEALSLLTSAAALLSTYVASSRTDRAAPVVSLKSPDALASEFALGGVTLSLVENGNGGGGQPALGKARILKALELSLASSVRTSHPRFFGQLYGRPEASGIAADWLVAACSAAVHTFEAAPVFVSTERAALAKLGRLAGGRYFDEEASEFLGDGLFLPGGSAANLAAMVAARHVADPEARNRGSWHGGSGRRGGRGSGDGEEKEPQPPPPRLVAFVSEHAHFSFDKAAIVSGLGLDNLIKIPCEEDGSMSCSELEAALADAVARGETPFFVGATSGTTVFGAFDSLRHISEIGLRYGVWLHADASWGGGALFSPTHRFLLDGIDLCDSFCVSPHKALGAPLQCSALVTRHAAVLAAANGVGGGSGGDSSRPGSASFVGGGNGGNGAGGDRKVKKSGFPRCSSNAADYLYQPDRPNSEHDVGDRYGGCGRRGDGFKLWLLCKSLGDGGMAARAEAGIGLASYAAAAIEARPLAFRLVKPPSYANVCFWYIPQDLRPLKEDCLGGVSALSREDSHLLAKTTTAIKAALQEEGSALISFARAGDKLPPFFRLVFASAWTVRTADVDALLDAIEEAGGAAGTLV